jgi:hypothetical protein
MARVREAAVVAIMAVAALGAEPLSGWPSGGDRAVLAGTVAPQETNFTLEGTITERAEGKLTVSTEENIIFHVRYGDKTEIKRKDGTAGAAKDLQKGAKIKVEGDLAESGEIIAQKIELE